VIRREKRAMKDERKGYGHSRGVNRPNMNQQVGRAQHGPTYNGPTYLYRLNILSGRTHQTFSRAYALLGLAVDMPLGHSAMVQWTNLHLNNNFLNR